MTDAEGVSIEELFEASHVPGPPPGKFTPKPLTELFNRKPKEWLVKNWFGRGDLVMIFGDSGAGKTFAVIDLVTSGALGESFADTFPVARQFKSLYCATEGLGGLGHRFREAIQSKELDRPDDWIQWMDVIPTLFEGKDEDGEKAFIDQVLASGFRPDVIVFDTLADAGQGSDENSNRDAMVVCKAVERIAKELDVAVIVIHHASKQSNGATYRGASVYKAKMDLQVSVTGGPANPRTMSCEKLKDGKQWQPILFEVAPWDCSAVVRWLGDRTPGITNQAAETLAWQTDLLDTLERVASSEQDAVEVKKISAGMKNPPDTKTITKYLASEKKDARIRSVTKKVLDKNGKLNKSSWHYWLEPEDVTK